MPSYHYYVSSIFDHSPAVRRLKLCPLKQDGREDNGIQNCAPGQYARVSFPGFDPRPFSIANHDDENCLEFLITRGGNGARAYACEQMTIGEHVKVEGPFGTMHENLNQKGPSLFLAGGTGIAPVLSMLEAKLEEKPDASLQLIFGLRDEQELFAHDELHALKEQYLGFSFDIIFSEQSDHPVYPAGLIPDKLTEHFQDLSEWSVFIAGPPPMISATLPVLLKLGLDPAHLYTDRENLSSTDLELLGQTA